MCVKVMSVCDVEYVWAIVQMYLMLVTILYNTVCVMLRLTLKMALRRHEFEYETVDVKLTPRLD